MKQRHEFMNGMNWESCQHVMSDVTDVRLSDVRCQMSLMILMMTRCLMPDDLMIDDTDSMMNDDS